MTSLALLLSFEAVLSMGCVQRMMNDLSIHSVGLLSALYIRGRHLFSSAGIELYKFISSIAPIVLRIVEPDVSE